MSKQKIGLNEEFIDTYFDDQDASMWCWAACIEGIFKYNRINVEMEDVVFRAFGALVNRGGPGDIMTKSLNIDALDRSGRPYFSRSTHWRGNPSPNLILNELSQHRAIILGIDKGFGPKGPQSHGVLLTSATYSFIDGNPIIHKVLIRDPWPTSDFYFRRGKQYLDANHILPLVINHWSVTAGLC